jgi:hypothetical protein
MNFLAFNAFVLLLPVASFAAWGWGSADEKWLIKVAFCALGPFCLDFWYLIGTHLVLRRQSSYLMQFLIFVIGYAGIFFVLKSGMVAF